MTNIYQISNNHFLILVYKHFPLNFICCLNIAKRTEIGVISRTYGVQTACESSLNDWPEATLRVATEFLPLSLLETTKHAPPLLQSPNWTLLPYLRILLFLTHNALLHKTITHHKYKVKSCIYKKIFPISHKIRHTTYSHFAK